MHDGPIQDPVEDPGLGQSAAGSPHRLRPPLPPSGPNGQSKNSGTCHLWLFAQSRSGHSIARRSSTRGNLVFSPAAFSRQNRPPFF